MFMPCLDCTIASKTIRPPITSSRKYWRQSCANFAANFVANFGANFVANFFPRILATICGLWSQKKLAPISSCTTRCFACVNFCVDFCVDLFFQRQTRPKNKFTQKSTTQEQRSYDEAQRTISTTSFPPQQTRHFGNPGSSRCKARMRATILQSAPRSTFVNPCGSANPMISLAEKTCLPDPLSHQIREKYDILSTQYSAKV